MQPSPTTANVIWLGLSGSLAASVGTAVGALGIFSVRRLSPALRDGLLSAAAGVMLAATFFSLLLPAMEVAEGQTGHPMPAVLIVIVGFLLGAVTLDVVHRRVPHEHFVAGREGPEAHRLSQMWLFVVAITLHNFPEGMAVGTGFAGGDTANGISLALGIGMQNIPEGLAVAVSLVAVGYSRARACAVGATTGLVEPLGGLVGSAAVSVAAPLMPWAMGFSAGAMLFIISNEIIPDTHQGSLANRATFALLGGFALMMFLDAVLG